MPGTARFEVDEVLEDEVTGKELAVLWVDAAWQYAAPHIHRQHRLFRRGREHSEQHNEEIDVQEKKRCQPVGDRASGFLALMRRCA